jgi:hypothetical protein
MKNLLAFCCVAFIITGCAVSKNFTPTKKYSPQQLQADYFLFQNILEEQHPGLHWYTSKDSMDFYFEKGRTMLRDSLTEPGFRTVLSYVISKLGCGHTSVRPSKQFAGFRSAKDSLRNHQFPLSLKLWKDTAIVTLNLNRKDSFIKRGSIVTAIDDKPIRQIIDSLFQFLSTDGYNLTHKYQTLSNRGTFGNWYLTVFGYRPSFKIDYIDSSGKYKTSVANIFKPSRDSITRIGDIQATTKKIPRRERKKLQLSGARSMHIDTSLQTAFMDVNTFTKGGRLRRFFKRSFKKLEENNTLNLVIDLRGNGGGSVTNSNLLTKYITDHRFKIADSLYAIKKTGKYGRYQKNHFSNSLFMFLMTKKEKDGNYHFNYFEGKHYKPKAKNHFNGNVYVLTGGNSFSASTLFAGAVKEQKNVFIVGEETGGGAYGNNAWLIPDVMLPVTKVRFRLPLFRLVIDKDEQKGYGVQPEVEVLPTVNAIRKNIDYKTEKAIELIKAQASKN